jgi:hypothetical protein
MGGALVHMAIIGIRVDRLLTAIYAGKNLGVYSIS